MTAEDYEFKVLTESQVTALREIQEIIGQGNRSRGFHDRTNRLLGAVAHQRGHCGHMNPAPNSLLWAEEALVDHAVATLALIGTEESEAIEEVRNGRALTETWFSAKTSLGTVAWSEGERPEILDDDVIGKPEGVPSEVADIEIRGFDFADRFKIDLAIAIDRKLAFNATRGRMHGGKKL